MRRLTPLLLFLFSVQHSIGQLSVDSIKTEEAREILSFLASDKLKGRGNYTKELHTAASFIANRFYKAGLKPIPGLLNYYHSFAFKEKSEAVKDSAGNYDPSNVLLNVIGILEGKSRPAEAIIFCAHYDHVGMEGGTIYNGANDDASGTTAMLLLADYFAKRGDNERTLIFCAFAGEELGLLGSSVLAEQINSDALIAVINIEMIGIASVGKNSFFITGAEYSDFKKIFQKNLEGSLKIRNEPSYSKHLFFRSDNYPFAKKGIPAHTIMSSDDDDKCYHKPCDDVERIDFDSMIRLVRGIANASVGIIKGAETPTRINPRKLR
jgi:Zn-dependent M28 family amino/carboxypeptidase